MKLLCLDSKNRKVELKRPLQLIIPLEIVDLATDKNETELTELTEPRRPRRQAAVNADVFRRLLHV